MEDLEDNIGIEQERKKAAEEKLASRNKLLVGIREGLDHLVQTLVSYLVIWTRQFDLWSFFLENIKRKM